MAVEGEEAASGGGADGRPSLESSALLSRLGDVSLWDLEVTAVEAISPSMRRIRCTAPGLGHLSYQPGQDLMLAVPGPGDGSFRRRYTIRSLDRATASVDIDVVLHGDGPAAAWAASCQPGQRIEAIGPRGKVTVQPEADWHLFAGDDSAMPASLAMAESLPTPEDALVVLEVDGRAERAQGFQRSTRGPGQGAIVRNFGPGRSTSTRSVAFCAAAARRAVCTMCRHSGTSSCAPLTRSTFMPASNKRATHSSVTSAASGAVTIT